MPDALQSVVQRMIDAGESEANIATVIQHYQKSGPQPVAASEPDTFMGGALKGLKDYAGEVGPRIGHAFTQSFNVPKMLADKQGADATATQDVQRMLDTGHADKREPWSLGTLQ